MRAIVHYKMYPLLPQKTAVCMDILNSVRCAPTG